MQGNRSSHILPGRVRIVITLETTVVVILHLTCGSAVLNLDNTPHQNFTVRRTHAKLLSDISKAKNNLNPCNPGNCPLILCSVFYLTEWEK